MCQLTGYFQLHQNSSDDVQRRAERDTLPFKCPVSLHRTLILCALLSEHALSKFKRIVLKTKIEAPICLLSPSPLKRVSTDVYNRIAITFLHFKPIISTDFKQSVITKTIFRVFSNDGLIASQFIFPKKAPYVKIEHQELRRVAYDVTRNRTRIVKHKPLPYVNNL